VIEAAAAGGLPLLVLRELQLPDRELRGLIERILPLRDRGLQILISRRLDLAASYALDGVHLAKGAAPIAEARARLGSGALIGYSAHEPSEAQRAAEQGASYVTLSPIYPTESKPGARARGLAWLKEAVRGLSIPALALGGITVERVPEVLAAGAWGVAAVSSVGAAADVEKAVRDFCTALGESHR
jgi:thiamine-phosphate pyrophosphorylase